MKKLFSDLIIWLKTPDPDTVFLKIWNKKRARDKVLQKIKSKQNTEEYRQKVEKEAYFLWEADGKPEGKEEYYWQLAIDKIEGKNLFTIYKPYYLLEKRILEPCDLWISKQAFFTILGRLGNLAVIAAVIAFIVGEEVRHNNEVFGAWTTITTAHGQSGSGGRIKALEFLNSRPWRFPWIGITEKGLYWDKQEERCKRKRLWGLRWEKEPLVGLSAPKAYLANIHLCEAFLERANLQGAELWGANLQGADLRGANLQEADLRGANLQESNLWRAKFQESNLWRANFQEAFLWGVNFQGAYLWRANFQGAYLVDTQNLTFKQIKSACFWEEAIYKGELNWEKRFWEVIEPDNTNYIEELKQDKASNPNKPVDCSGWENSNSPK